MPSRPGEFHPEPLTDPDLILSHHPARAIARRLPPSAEHSGSSRFDPVGPSSTAMTCPLCSTGITPLHRYYGGSPPLSGASVLSASRDPRRLRASGRDGGGVMNRPPSPLTCFLSRHTRRREFIAGLGGAAGWPLLV